MLGIRSIAVALSMLFAVSPVVPAAGYAMPKMTVQPVQAGEGGIDLVRCEGPRCRDFRRDRREARRDYRRGYRAGYHNGHRGYRYARPGYRYHDGYWFPLAAFATGAIIGGAVTAPRAPVYSGGGTAHTQWCYNRYRSYRAYDNTFQPYSGPRQQCYSPYG